MHVRVGAAVWICAAIIWSAGDARAQTPAQIQQPQGKVVSISGRVDHASAGEERWLPARILQPLLVADRVRTLEASRAAILFVDETQVKLNAGAVLIVRQVRAAGGPATSMELQRGEAWFRTKNPRSGLTIQTPAAAAAIRGTEIDLRIGPGGETTLTVVEGAAEFFNPQGTVLVNAGEEGLALPGRAPTKRTVLNPEDAVQWALYYPLRVASADLASVRPADAEHERRVQLAALALEAGDAASARREIDAVLAVDPTARGALVLLSSMELRANRPEAARQAADRALAAHPRSVGALIAASEAAQARFDLDAARAYLDRALAIDPDEVHALVNRARIRFGTDDTEGARADTERAARVAPDDPQVRSLRGFIRLAAGDVSGARADLQAAVAGDAGFGEPHLGLGLLHFRERQVEQGLEAMLTATLLEPNVALYQSYLGKAYYQAGRFPEGLSALASAKRLDPRDPTPWLYTSFFLRDQNRQVDALRELRQAMALNDHRAVYRGRLLLDRDLATKNVSLAETYRQLGFEAWGAFEALNSLEADLTNSGAHLFLAETYGGLPDRTEALGSELLQYFLYAPVNRNVFNSFAEYTALLEQPRRQLDARAETGTRERAFGDLTHRFGNERFAHVAFIQAWREDGTHADRDDDNVQGFVQAKVSITPRSDVFFSYSGVRVRQGAPELTTRVVGGDVFNSVILRQFDPSPDPQEIDRFRSHELTLGLKHEWRAGSAFTAAARYQDLEQTVELPSSFITCSGLDLRSLPPFSTLGARVSRVTRLPMELVDLQVQQATRLGRHQVVVGQQWYTTDKATRCQETFRFAGSADTFDNAVASDGHDTGAQTYIRDDIRLASWLHVHAGLVYQRVAYDDELSATTYDVDRWNPRVGVSVRVTPATVVRGAAFRQMHINALGSSIAPPTVGGFVVARNEFPTATRTEYNLSLEHARPRAFVAVRALLRDGAVPYLLDNASFIPEADARGAGGSLHVNWIANDRVTVFAEDQFVRFDSRRFDRYDNLVRAGINVIHPRGFFARVAGSHVTQRFVNTSIAGLPTSNFTLADLRLAYEFAGKRGLASLEVTNAFDERFDAVVENLSIDTFLPRRRVVASLRWRLW